MRSLAVLLVLVFAVAVGLDLTPAQALPPSVEGGAELTARWCADCHQDSSHDAPSFPAIAAKRSLGELRTLLAKPHSPAKGSIRLNRREADDVAAYIKTLAP